MCRRCAGRLQWVLLLPPNSHVDDVLSKGGEIPVAFVVLANQTLERVKHDPKLVDQIRKSIIQVSVTPGIVLWLPHNRVSLFSFLGVLYILSDFSD